MNQLADAVISKLAACGWRPASSEADLATKPFLNQRYFGLVVRPEPKINMLRVAFCYEPALFANVEVNKCVLVPWNRIPSDKKVAREIAIGALRIAATRLPHGKEERTVPISIIPEAKIEGHTLALIATTGVAEPPIASLVVNSKSAAVLGLMFYDAGLRVIAAGDIPSLGTEADQLLLGWPGRPWVRGKGSPFGVVGELMPWASLGRVDILDKWFRVHREGAEVAGYSMQKPPADELKRVKALLDDKFPKKAKKASAAK